MSQARRVKGGHVGAPDGDAGTAAAMAAHSCRTIRSALCFVLRMSPVSSENSMHTLKVLALGSSGRELHTVLNFLRAFPCLERLYVIFHKHNEIEKKNDPQYDPQHPIECLQTHLKKVVFKSFVGYEKQLDFARFFVLNAKVLNKIEFEGYCDYNSESVAYQHKVLQVENRASRDAKVEFRRQYIRCDFDKGIHDLSVADPFRQL